MPIERNTDEGIKIEILKLEYSERWQEVRHHVQVARDVGTWLIITIGAVIFFIVSTFNTIDFKIKFIGIMTILFFVIVSYWFLIQNYLKWKTDLEAVIKINRLFGFFESGVYSQEQLLPDRWKEIGNIKRNPTGMLFYLIMITFVGLMGMIYLFTC